MSIPALRLRFSLVVAGLVLALAGLSVRAGELAPSATTYTLSRGVLGLGEAHFQLKPVAGKNDCYRYEYRATPRGLARFLIGEVRETSDFCIVDGKIRSRHFEFRRADKAQDNFSLDFDWSKNVVRSSKGELRQLTDDMMDRLAMQLAVQRWVIQRKGQLGPETISFTKVEDDRAKVNRFQIAGRETLKVPAGTFETLRVERVDNARRATTFWVAPKSNYTLIRVEQIKDGTQQFKAELVK